MQTDGEWTRELPRSIRKRFDSLGKYVRAILEEAGLRGRLTREDIERIHIAVFVRVLDEFLRDGTAAAVAAVDTLNELGVQGFTVGRERFAGRNDAVMRGERLANTLQGVAGDLFPPDVIESESGLKRLIIKLGKELASRGRRMDRAR